MTQQHVGSLTHLRAAGVSVVLDSRGRLLPAVVHWGTDLGDLSAAELADLVVAARPPLGDSEFGSPQRVCVVPTEAEGWLGTPGLSGSRGGRGFSPRFTLVDERETAGGRTYLARDEEAALDLSVFVELTSTGLVRLRAGLVNRHEGETYDLDGLGVALPVPSEADEIQDLAGTHTNERTPQRLPFVVGAHKRESRQGRPGLDSSYLLAAGRAGFGFTSGQVWGVHVAWSGNQVATAERSFNGLRVLSAGELLLPGELTLAPGEAYESPWVYGSYGEGLNELSGRFHRHLRARSHHPARTRPVLLNTWEAVYFDHDLEKLGALAEVAASVGVERFVLDDGWFLGRRDDTAGLGDWEVDETVWPGGLHALVDKVTGLGMEFGLWVEPEMVNLDSRLAREHPHWVLRPGEEVGLPSRQQHVLDLGNPDAYKHVATLLHRLLDTYPIAYLKWDHNRVVTQAGQSGTGRPGVHAHTKAAYRLLDELRRDHPGLEIESCSGGGGRIDLGILERTDRVWASDCIDALDRQKIQRYTQLLLPPELVGTHIGAARSHTTGRVHDLDFRAAAAMWGHLGIEWDLTAVTPDELDRTRRWVALHKRLRPLLHTGTVVVGDHPDPAVWVNGVVSPDADEAVYGLTTVGRSSTWPPGRVRLPGLDPERRYEVRPLEVGEEPLRGANDPQWCRSGLRVTGKVLAAVGVQMPPLWPERTRLVSVVATA